MTFKELGIIDPILRALEELSYKEATPIQVQAIPSILQGKDQLGSAQTGTGKTAAFALPILQQMFLYKERYNKRSIKALILSPTRELASQIEENFRLYAKYLHIKSYVIYGGVSQSKQVIAIKNGIDVLVATPGRLLDLLGQKVISLKNVEFFVLDEADQMLDMGFIHDVRKIIQQIPSERQTMLFSATMPKAIELLAREILNKPVRIEVTPVEETLTQIKQYLYYVPKKQKTSLLTQILKKKNVNSALVFTRTKRAANKVSQELSASGILSEAIHGNKSQNAREKALSSFKQGKVKVLVATDIAARGIDITGIEYVFNFDLPEVPEIYIHRIGRTGRAGQDGISIAFCDEEEKPLLNQIVKHIKLMPEVIKL